MKHTHENTEILKVEIKSKKGIIGTYQSNKSVDISPDEKVHQDFINAFLALEDAVIRAKKFDVEVSLTCHKISITESENIEYVDLGFKSQNKYQVIVAGRTGLVPIDAHNIRDQITLIQTEALAYLNGKYEDDGQTKIKEEK